MYNGKSEGKLISAIRDAELTGELGKARLMSALDKEFGTVCVVGLGKANPEFSTRENLNKAMENVRIAAAKGAKKLRNNGCSTIYVDPMEYPEQAAEGSALSPFGSTRRIRG